MAVMNGLEHKAAFSMLEALLTVFEAQRLCGPLPLQGVLCQHFLNLLSTSDLLCLRLTSRSARHRQTCPVVVPDEGAVSQHHRLLHVRAPGTERAVPDSDIQQPSALAELTSSEGSSSIDRHAIPEKSFAASQPPHEQLSEMSNEGTRDHW